MKRILTTFFLSALLLTSSAGVYGISPEQRALFRSGIHWYDTVAVETFCAAGEVVNLVGRNNVEKVYNYFRSRGLTPKQSAAIVGNFMVETGGEMNPAIKQGPRIGGQWQTFSTISEVENSDGGLGFGLAQWTHDSRQTAWVEFVRENGHTITDLGSQLEWTWHEWPSRSYYGKDKFLEADPTDLRQLTWIFLAYYERPGAIRGYEQQLDQPRSGPALGSLDERERHAQEALLRFGGNTVYAIDAANSCLAGTEATDFKATGVRIDGSPSGRHVRSNCSAGFTDGASVLKQFIVDTWKPPVTGVGGFNCRPINNCGPDDRRKKGEDYPRVGERHCKTTPTSIHGLGRALDIHINLSSDKDTGEQIRNWLINNSEAIGVQRIIWNYHSWNSQRDGWNAFGGHSHTGHIHMEINKDGATKSLPWYIGR